MMRNVVFSQQNGARILETLECGHTNDCVNPSCGGEVECIQCDIDFAAVAISRAEAFIYEMREHIEDDE